MGRLSPVSFTRAPPTGREAVLTPPPPPPLVPGLVLSLSERNVLLMFPGSGRFLSLNNTNVLLISFLYYCESLRNVHGANGKTI